MGEREREKGEERQEDESVSVVCAATGMFVCVFVSGVIFL